LSQILDNMNNNPFEFFDKIFFINLDDRPERRINVESQLKKYNIVAERFPAVQLTLEENEILKNEGCVFNSDDRPEYSRFAKSCALSHLHIILRSKLMNYKNVLILEDDVVFSDTILKNLHKTLIDLQSQPKWDMFYLGCNPFGYKKITDNLSISFGAYAAHAYAVNNHFYDTILKIPFKVLPVIDVYYYNLATNPLYKIFMSTENLAWQTPGYSTIEEKTVNYYPIIKKSYKLNIII
jgi:GR25 family glycosyltransferase involved in LPS biosynthesis